MKSKKSVLTSLECINANLNTLIVNQEMTYFILREILKKMTDQKISSPQPLRLGVKRYKSSLPAFVGRDFYFMF